MDDGAESLADGGPPDADMVRIPGGTFRMGSDKHYPEEAPVHRVTVNTFLMDATPVTNRQFKEFVKATGHTRAIGIIANDEAVKGGGR
jgi:formylglycine-generating enzyme required for sulfatase activity